MDQRQSAQNLHVRKIALCVVFVFAGFATQVSHAQVDDCSALFACDSLGCDSLSCDSASCCGDNCGGEGCICKKIRQCFAESGITFSNNLTQYYFGTVSGG
ncbi:MAG: carbohydrate porin, partial [Rhodopirellula bahusiensis]